MDQQASEAGIGHNNPPDLLTTLSEQHAQLRHDIEKLAVRATVARADIVEIKVDNDLEVVGTLIKDARTLNKRADDTRKKVKDPYLQAGRDVNTFFAVFTDRLTKIGNHFQSIGDAYQRKVADEARAKAQAESKRLREEEEKRIELARKAQEDNRPKHAEQHIEKAAAATRQAEAQEQVAQASAADLTRTRTASGVLATAQTEWAFAIEDFDAIDLNKLRSLFKRDAIEAAIRQAVKNGQRQIAGVRIFEETKARFR